MSSKSSNRTVTLSDLIGPEGVFVDGDWIESKDQDPHGDVRLVQLADIGDGSYLRKSSRYITSETARRLRCTYLKDGDILIARMPDPIGRACIFEAEQKPCITAVDVCILRPDDSLVDSKWLVHLINASGFRRNIRSYTTGTTRKRISRSNLDRIKFLLPPLEEQRRIAEVLDRADALRQKRRLALQKLDTLLQSVFLDMFGDPETNSHSLPVSPLGKLVRLQGGFAFKSADYTENGTKLVKISNVHFEKLTWDETDFLPESYLNKYSEFELRDGDIVVALTRPIIKSLNSVKVARVSSPDLPCLLNQRVGRFVIRDADQIDPSFLLHLCYSQFFKKRIIRYSSESLQPNVSPKQIEDIQIPIPPIEKQRKFAAISVRVALLKGTAGKGLGAANELFQSVQTRAFNGELLSESAPSARLVS